MSIPSNPRFFTKFVPDDAKVAWPDVVLNAAAKFAEYVHPPTDRGSFRFRHETIKNQVSAHRHARFSFQSGGLRGRRGGGRSTRLRIVETATRPGPAMDRRAISMTAGSLTPSLSSSPRLHCTNYMLSLQPADLVKDIRLENIYDWFLFTACNCLNTYRFCCPQRWPTH